MTKKYIKTNTRLYLSSSTYAWPNSCAAVSTKLNVMSSFMETLLVDEEHTVLTYATPMEEYTCMSGGIRKPVF